MNNLTINNLNNNSSYLEQYINYMESQNKSTNTIKSYTKDITAFFKYFNTNPTTLTRNQITQYRDYLLNTKNIDAKSINRALSSLKSYNEFLVKQGHQDNLIVLSQDYIKIQKQLLSPTNTSKNEAIRFMEKVSKNEPVRNYYIVRLLLNTGLRISEALSIELDNINFKKEYLKIIGKGSKQRIIPLNKTAIEVIKLAIEDRKNYKYATNSSYLFVSNKGEKLESCTIERIFNKYSNVITPHVCRHIFATNFLENGGSLKELQQILGHSSLETTQIYLHPSKNDLKKNVNNCAI